MLKIIRNMAQPPRNMALLRLEMRGTGITSSWDHAHFLESFNLRVWDLWHSCTCWQSKKLELHKFMRSCTEWAVFFRILLFFLEDKPLTLLCLRQEAASRHWSGLGMKRRCQEPSHNTPTKSQKSEWQHSSRNRSSIPDETLASS